MVTPTLPPFTEGGLSDRLLLLLQIGQWPESEDVMENLLAMISLLVAAVDEAAAVAEEAGVYDQRPYGWLGENGLRARAIALLAARGAESE